MKVLLILSFMFSLATFSQEIPGDHLEFNLQDEQIEKVVVKKNKKKKDLTVLVHVNDSGAKAINEMAAKNPGKEISVYSRKRFLEKFKLTPGSPKLKAFRSLEPWRSETEITKVWDKLPTIFEN